MWKEGGGNLATGKEKTEFLIQIKSQENYSWQGTIHWLKENKKEHFRSAIELIRLIDSALLEKSGEAELINSISNNKKEEE